MRTVEIERLNFLRQKRDNGETLSDKELLRLESLEEKEAAELQKEDKSNGPGGNSFNGSDSTGNNRSGREVGSEGPGNQPTNRNQSASIASNSNNPGNGVGGQTGNNARSDRAEGREVSGQDRGNNRGSESTGDRGTEGSSADSGSGRGGASGQETSQLQGTSNLKKPRDVKPNRKSAAPDKKKANSGQLDQETIGALIQSGFSLIANATGHKIWEISEDEALSVAAPTEKLIDQLSAAQKKKIEKYSTPIMLASAVAGIVVPRVMFEMYNRRSGNGKTNKTNDSAIEVKQVSTGDILPPGAIGGPIENGRNTNDAPLGAPVNDEVISGLFNSVVINP